MNYILESDQIKNEHQIQLSDSIVNPNNVNNIRGGTKSISTDVTLDDEEYDPFDELLDLEKRDTDDDNGIISEDFDGDDLLL